MGENPKLDDELAAFTDDVLAGKSPQMDDAWRDLAQVVEQVHRTIAPDAAPDFRDQLAQRLTQEWNRQPQRRTRRSLTWRSSRVFQLSALAAVMVAVLLGVALLASQGDDGKGTVEGTAIGSIPTAALVLAVVVIGGGIVWGWKRRNH